MKKTGKQKREKKMDERIAAVITANKARQKQARDLNARSGEKTFPVLTREEMTAWLIGHLDGVTSVATVKDFERLQLPPLDSELIEFVVRENPDTIEIFGRQCVVEYADSYGRPRVNPLVRIDFQGEQARDWLKLPDVVRLPSGREVAFYSVVDGYGYYIESKSSEFKMKARACLNEGQWTSWSMVTRPVIALPDPVEEGSVVAEVVTACYGKCVVTGVALSAFGVASSNHNRYQSGDPWFKVFWTRDPAEAEKVRADSVLKLEAIRAEERKKREYEVAKADAEVSRQELQSLSRREGWYDLDYGTRDEVERRCYAYLPDRVEEIRRWIFDTKALVAKVNEAIADLQKRREEEARASAEAERIEREDLAPILEKTENLQEARAIRDFAQHIEDARGLDRAVQILRKELDAPYGRARRQSAIRQQIPGLEDSASSDFLYFQNASSVDLWLNGALSWLEAKLQKCTARTQAEPEHKGAAVDLSQGITLFGQSVQRRKK